MEGCFPGLSLSGLSKGSSRYNRYHFVFASVACQVRLVGTLAPALRASERPMAMACFRDVTIPPFPPLPERSVPSFFRCRALFTLLPAALPYFLLDPFFFGI